MILIELHVQQYYNHSMHDAPTAVGPEEPLSRPSVVQALAWVWKRTHGWQHLLLGLHFVVGLLEHLSEDEGVFRLGLHLFALIGFFRLGVGLLIVEIEQLSDSLAQLLYSFPGTHTTHLLGFGLLAVVLDDA